MVFSDYWAVKNHNVNSGHVRLLVIGEIGLTLRILFFKNGFSFLFNSIFHVN